MSSKGQHVQDNSVAERRLRPIYDWLDVGNNKKALQECEKVLKKTPGLQCAKALKALTLHRMGREPEAHAILEALTNEQPTDDATLQAISLCYRELQQLDKICKLYESAIKLDPTNEELFTHLFMSYARIFDFKQQQQAAITLYKHKPKTPYYCWAVMSIVLQATRGEGKNDRKKRSLLLSLAERMMEKLIIDGKLDAEQEVQLYVMVLELQQKYEEIIVILDGPLGTKLACSNLPQNRLKYLISLERWTEVNLLCKNILIESVDRWDIWKEYVNSVFKLLVSSSSVEANNHNSHDAEENDMDTVDDTPEKCHEFICRIVENGADNGFLLRGPYLARFELCSRLLESNADPSDVLGDIIELFIEYFRKFGHKACCVSDLRLYLNLLDNEKKAELSSRLIKDVGITSTSVPQSEQQMQRHLCALQLSRLCGAHRNLSSDHLRALVTSFSLHYEHGYHNYGKNLLSTDLGPSDPYALLAAHVLYDAARVERSSDPIVAALILLDNMLKNSPSNFHAKLLSVRLYHTIGGCLGAQNMYNSLDMKHLQLDSLGFIHCARLATTGLLSTCSNLFDVTLKFFSSNYKDSSDHITFSYKYGSFIKLDEFMDFRERLNNSMHYTTVAVDRIVLSLIECTNLDGLLNIDISPKDNNIEWEALRDNHDLNVYISWDPETHEESTEIKRFFEHNLLFLKLRTSALWCMAAAVDIVKSTDGVRIKHLEQLRNSLQDWRNLWTGSRERNYVPLCQNRVTLPLPSRLHVALDTPHFEVVGNVFQILLDIALENCSIDESLQIVDSSLAKSLKILEEMMKDEERNNDLTYRRETMEYVVNIMEIMSLSTLACVICSDFNKPLHGKKGKRKNAEAGSKDLVSQLATNLKKHINNFTSILQSWSNQNMSTDLPGFLESLNIKNNEGQSVCENVTNSYVFACREIQCVLKSKIKVLNSVL